MADSRLWRFLEAPVKRFGVVKNPNPMSQSSWERGRASAATASDTTVFRFLQGTCIPAALAAFQVIDDLVLRVVFVSIASIVGFLLVPLSWAGVVALRAPSTQRGELRAALRDAQEKTHLPSVITLRLMCLDQKVCVGVRNNGTTDTFEAKVTEAYGGIYTPTLPFWSAKWLHGTGRRLEILKDQEELLHVATLPAVAMGRVTPAMSGIPHAVLEMTLPIADGIEYPYGAVTFHTPDDFLEVWTVVGFGESFRHVVSNLEVVLSLMRGPRLSWNSR